MRESDRPRGILGGAATAAITLLRTVSPSSGAGMAKSSILIEYRLFLIDDRATPSGQLSGARQAFTTGLTQRRGGGAAAPLRLCGRSAVQSAAAASKPTVEALHACRARVVGAGQARFRARRPPGGRTAV